MIGCRYCLIPGLQVQAVRFASLSLGCFATPCYALLWVAAFGQIGKVSCMCQGAASRNLKCNPEAIVAQF